MERRTVRLIPLLVVAGVVGAGCSDSDGDVSVSDDAVITYHFGDSSVPPEYHRSYTLTITKDQVHAVVDSYGDVVGETTEALPPRVWDQLVDGVDDVTSIDADAIDSGCTGGTSRDLTIKDAGAEVVAVDLEVCNGNDTQSDQLDAYVEPVIGAIPDWEEIVAPD